MNVHHVDEAIDRYVHERMTAGRQQASRRFLVYASLKCDGDEWRQFLQKVGGLSRYYIDFFRVMQNPFKGPEFAWFLSLIVMAIYGGLLMTDEDSRVLGIITLSGALVNGSTLVLALLKKWCRLGVLIAVYRELVELAEQEAAV